MNAWAQYVRCVERQQGHQYWVPTMGFNSQHDVHPLQRDPCSEGEAAIAPNLLVWTGNAHHLAIELKEDGLWT